MSDSRVARLTKLGVHYSVNVKPKERVLVRGNISPLPLIGELYKCLKRGRLSERRKHLERYKRLSHKLSILKSEIMKTN